MTERRRQHPQRPCYSMPSVIPSLAKLYRTWKAASEPSFLSSLQVSCAVKSCFLANISEVFKMPGQVCFLMKPRSVLMLQRVC